MLWNATSSEKRCANKWSWVADRLQMISCDEVGVGSSRSWLWHRLSERRWIRPQGTTDGSELRQLRDRSRTVIRDDTSMNQSRSNQDSFSPDQSTCTAWGWGRAKPARFTHIGVMMWRLQNPRLKKHISIDHDILLLWTLTGHKMFKH